MKTQEIRIYRNAPVKPQLGDPCNGCGICCLAEPCPISQLLFLKKSGQCPAVVWQHQNSRYECGMIITPSQHHRLIPFWADQLLIIIFKRWIAAGKGCDSSASITD
jgi:hypothetical protein